VGEKESLETKDGEQESLETKERIMRRDVRNWDIRNLRIEPQVAEIRKESHG